MIDLVMDPVFWLAVGAWLVVLIFALALCAVGGRADRIADRARRDRIADRYIDRDLGGWRKP